jgi:hypothetical protein
VERCELTVLNQWVNPVVAGKSSDFLVVIAFVTQQDVNMLGIALDQRLIHQTRATHQLNGYETMTRSQSWSGRQYAVQALRFQPEARSCLRPLQPTGL